MKRNPSLHQFIFDKINEKAPELASRWNVLSPIVGTHEEREAMVAANQYWRLQLGVLPVSTIHARSCLIDTLGYDEWCYDFVKCVLPLILSYGLPATGV